MSLASILTLVAQDLALAVPTSFIGNRDETATRLVACAQLAGEQLARKPENGWVAMIAEYDFVTAAVAQQSGTVANSGPGGVAVISGLSGISAVAPLTWYGFGTGLPNNSIVAAILHDSFGPAGVGSAGAGPQNQVILSTASTAAMTSGDMAVIAGVVGTTEANGTWAIDVFDATTIGLRGTIFVHPYVSGGTITGANIPRIQMNVAATTLGAGQFTFGQSDYPLPSGFQRVIDGTLWDRSRYWAMRGPMSPQEWQLYKSSVIGNASIQRRFRFREIGGNQVFSIDPVPTDNNSALVFEYVSNAWCKSQAGALQTSWEADTDLGVLDEYLITLSVRWRMMRRLGFAYAEELDEYDREVSKAVAKDGGQATLNLVGSPDGLQLLGPYNLPESNYPGP